MDITYDLLFVTDPTGHQASSTVMLLNAHNSTTEAGIEAADSRYCQQIWAFYCLLNADKNKPIATTMKPVTDASS